MVLIVNRVDCVGPESVYINLFPKQELHWAGFPLRLTSFIS